MLRATTTFTLLYSNNITTPFQPLSLGLTTRQQSEFSGVVAVGGRDCPDNTKSMTFLYDLNSGKSLTTPTTAKISQLSVAREASTMNDLVSGVSWLKDNSTTGLFVPGGAVGDFPQLYDGDPSMQIPTASTETGDYVSFLLEPNPDTIHLNNRTGTLLLVDGTHGKVLHEINVTGQGSYDPQSLDMSSRIAAKRSTITIGAVFGSINTVYDYDVRTQTLAPVFTTSGLEVDIAIDGEGENFAVTSGGGLAVDVYTRNVTSGKFQQVQTIKPPSSAVQPMALKFARGDVAFNANGNETSFPPPFLAVVWTDQTGVQLDVTAHVVENGVR